MTMAPFHQLRQQLLGRWVAGEIDRTAYQDALLEIERMESSGQPLLDSNTPLPGLSDTAHDQPAPARRYESIGEVRTNWQQVHQLRAGNRLGNLSLISRIGRGGMGEVWKAFDEVGDRHVVVKVLPPELQHNDAEMTRIKETFQRVHSLQHQHICPIYLLGHDAQIGYYLVMKHIEGVTLAEYRPHAAHESKPLSLAECVRILTPIAEALDYAHSKKVIHRDIKPQNILVSRDGADVQLVDFGLAAEIRTSMTRVSQAHSDTSGTYPYMPPEQWKGEHQDGKSDQYALAVVAYELLSGMLPFEAPDAFILRQCVLHEQLRPLSNQPDWANAALLKGLAKTRAERFSSCVEFVRALSVAPQQPRPEATRKWPESFVKAEVIEDPVSPAKPGKQAAAPQQPPQRKPAPQPAPAAAKPEPARKPVEPVVSAAVTKQLAAQMVAPAVPRVGQAPKQGSGLRKLVTFAFVLVAVGVAWSFIAEEIRKQQNQIGSPTTSTTEMTSTYSSQPGDPTGPSGNFPQVEPPPYVEPTYAEPPPYAEPNYNEPTNGFTSTPTGFEGKGESGLSEPGLGTDREGGFIPLPEPGLESPGLEGEQTVPGVVPDRVEITDQEEGSADAEAAPPIVPGFDAVPAR